jgi:hypothetical protein
VGSGKSGWIDINGTHQIVVDADEVNILCGGLRTIKENTEALVGASTEIGLDKSKNMVLS